MACKRCGSYAINHHCHGRDGADADLCDVCYWRRRAENPPLFVRYRVDAPSTVQSAHRHHGLRVLAPRLLDQKIMTVYPLTGDAHSLMIETLYLVPSK